MGSLLRNAWQSMAPVSASMTEPPSFSTPGTLQQRAPDVSSGVQLQKRQGMDGERSERRLHVSAARPHARQGERLYTILG